MRAPSREALFTASVAGEVAGLAMLAVAMLAALATGRALVWPLQVMAALFSGPEALREASAATLLSGFLAHQLGPTVLWSRAFGMMVGFRRTPWALGWALGFGVLTGVVALLTDVYLFMPRVQKQLHARDLWAEHLGPGVSWLMHLVFGLALGLCFWRWQARPPKA